jgi:hypothetical protein
VGGIGDWARDFVSRLSRRHEGRVRAALAAALERSVAEVDRPLRRGGAAVGIDRGQVAEAAPLLLRLADRLGEGPVPGLALALTRSICADGTGPLYSISPHRSDYPPGTLSDRARAALALCGSHTGPHPTMAMESPARRPSRNLYL